MEKMSLVIVVIASGSAHLIDGTAAFVFAPSSLYTALKRFWGFLGILGYYIREEIIGGIN
jgi:hypothetical protein